MNGSEITRATFSVMPAKDKLNVLFDLAQRNHNCACKTEKKLETLEKKFDRRKKVDTSIAASFGFIGGIVAQLGWLLTGGQKPPT